MYIGTHKQFYLKYDKICQLVQIGKKNLQI